MDAPFEFSTDAVSRLRDGLNDLVSIMALPALWTDGEPPLDVGNVLNVLNVLPEMLDRIAEQTSALAAANQDLRNDVAERQRAEDALREREHESRLIVDSIPGLVALLASSGDLEVVNRQVFEYFGQTLDELKRWGMTDVVHTDDLPHVIDVFTESMVSGNPYKILQRFRRSDGVYRWFQNSGFPLRDTNGQIVRWCVLLTDIDDQKRAEDAIRASERNLKLIIDTMPALAWSARTDGSADFFNQHYLDFIGLSEEQASGWGWTAAVHPEDFEQPGGDVAGNHGFGSARRSRSAAAPT